MLEHNKFIDEIQIRDKQIKKLKYLLREGMLRVDTYVNFTEQDFNGIIEPEASRAWVEKVKGVLGEKEEV